MTHTERDNPIAVRAAARRAQWEMDAQTTAAQERHFWSKKRFDLIDLCILLSLVPAILMAALAFTH